MDKTVALATMEKFDNRMPDSVGSSRIRMRWMLPFWEEAEEYVIGKKYDTMIFQKVYWREMMDKFEGVKILDLCVSGDTLIYTNKGWKYITEIKVGNLVLTHKGRFKKVLKVHTRLSATKVIKAAGLERLKITGNHLLWANNFYHNGYGKRMNGKWEWIPLENLVKAERHKKGFYLGSIKSEEKTTEDVGKPDLAYFMGYYMAEGTHSHHQVSFSMSKKEILIKDKIMDVIKNLGFEPTYRPKKDDGAADVYFGDTKWVKHLKENVGVLENKRFPEWVNNLRKSDKVTFLEAYLNGDGYCNDVGGIESNTISKKLAFGIWKLYKDLGLKPQILKKNRDGEAYGFKHKNGKVYLGKDQWVVRLNPTESIKFLDMGTGCLYKKTNDVTWKKNKSANNEIKYIDGYDAHPIRKIEEGEIMPVYNLEVEEDNSFVADGYIIHGISLQV